MVRFLLSLVVVLGIANAASAQVCPRCGRVHSMQASYGGNGIQVLSTQGSGQALALAMRSAMDRATNNISGHSVFDSVPGYHAGVGHSWARGMQPNQRPDTCYQQYLDTGGIGAYVAVRKGNQVYSSAFYPSKQMPKRAGAHDNPKMVQWRLSGAR